MSKFHYYKHSNKQINYCSVFKGLFDICCIVESYITQTRIGVSDTGISDAGKLSSFKFFDLFWGPLKIISLYSFMNVLGNGYL